MSAVVTDQPAQERALWRQVAIPAEHGGWGLTLEPVLLGLLVAWSWSGLALGVAAFAAFLARTPLKLVMVDRRRDRALARTRLAAGIASVEIALVLGLAVVAWWSAGPVWFVPVAIAAPLVAVESWFDVRSRGRRLLPELCGAVGIAASSAAIVVAGGGGARLAAAMWLLLAARSLAAIPFARVQIFRLRRGQTDTRASDGAQLAGLAVAAVAVATEHRALAGALMVGVVAVVHVWWVRRPPVAAKVLGMRLMVLGLAVVAAAATGVLAG